jgi:hypothetical protein
VIHGLACSFGRVEERDHWLIHAWQNDPEVWWLMVDRVVMSVTREGFETSKAAADLRRHGDRRSHFLLSLFLPWPLPAHSLSDLREREVDLHRGRRYVSPRSKQST